MLSGWIKEYRKLLDNPISKKPFHCHLWNILLLKANHKKSEFIFNNKVWGLKPGQLLTGRRKLAEETGVSESQIERILKYLENAQQITQQKTNKFRIITIVNWAIYQGMDNNETATDTTSAQQKDSKRTHTRSNKNVKNDNNKNISEFDECRKLFQGRKRGLQTEYDYFTKHKDWREALSLLRPAVEREIQYRENAVGFVPEWKNFKTWIYNRCWEDILPQKETTAEQVERLKKEGKITV